MGLYLYTSKRHRRATGQNFEYYYDKKTGQPIYWKDDRNENVERGPFIKEHSRMLNTDNPQDAKLLAYLQNHPGKGARFELINQTAVIEAQEAEVGRYTKLTRAILTYDKAKADALFEMLDYPDSSPHSQGLLIQSMRDPNIMNQVEEAMSIKNMPMIIAIRRMIKYGVIIVENGIYKAAHNGEKLAITELQLAEQLEKDSDLLRLMEGEANRKEATHKQRQKSISADISKLV